MTIRSFEPGRRQGYASVDPAYMKLVNQGVVETRTHVEQMSADMALVYDHSFGTGSASSSRRFAGLGFLDRLRAGGAALLDRFGADALAIAADHQSDIVRGWGAFAVGQVPGVSLERRFALALPFADDHHFAVREWAWLGVRPQVVGAEVEAVQHLQVVAAGSSPYARRFAIELTRPRSVWGVHSAALKDEPWMAELLLGTAALDRTRYVEDSVANWLNDARKTQPEWVIALCDRWLVEHGPQLDRLRRRALRLPGRSV